MQQKAPDQTLILLRNYGFIDPKSIDQYIAKGGYSGLKKALGMSPEAVINEVKQSGLRGRAGAGFPTGEKWRICRQTISDQKYIICNASESSPGTRIGKILLEHDPHSILEGIIIGAYAVGATKGYLYINSELTEAIDILKIALKQMSEKHLIGDKILDSAFNFNLEIRESAGSLGEESAVISSIEGKRAMSFARPPYPAVKGLFGKPTLINNIETWANVSVIFQKSAAWYSSIGSEKSKGTKLVNLNGNVLRPKLYEVPMGATLRYIIETLGKGISNVRKFKAVQVGGISGAFLNESALDTPFDYESLANAGTIMGSAQITVFDDSNCIVDITKHVMSLINAESCGKCVFCREGTVQMFEFLKDITEGNSKLSDIELLIELAESAQLGSLCSLGKTSANPVLSSIKLFKDEYVAHIVRKECPAAVCTKLNK